MILSNLINYYFMLIKFITLYILKKPRSRKKQDSKKEGGLNINSCACGMSKGNSWSIPEPSEPPPTPRFRKICSPHFNKGGPEGGGADYATSWIFRTSSGSANSWSFVSEFICKKQQGQKSIFNTNIIIILFLYHTLRLLLHTYICTYLLLVWSYFLILSTYCWDLF